MRHIFSRILLHNVLPGCVAALLLGLAAGCNSGTKASHTVTFISAEPAPAEFDGVSFYWSLPAFPSNAAVHCVVAASDGKKATERDMSHLAQLKSPIHHLDIMKKDADGDLTPLQGKPVHVTVSVTEGQMNFPENARGYFMFYKMGSNGRIDLKNPVKTVSATRDGVALGGPAPATQPPVKPAKKPSNNPTNAPATNAPTEAKP